MAIFSPLGVEALRSVLDAVHHPALLQRRGGDKVGVFREGTQHGQNGVAGTLKNVNYCVPLRKREREKEKERKVISIPELTCAFFAIF